MHIYASCGVWKFDPCKGWGFAFDREKGGRVLAVELTSSFEDLRTTAFEDFGIDQNNVELELSYLPMELITTTLSLIRSNLTRCSESQVSLPHFHLEMELVVHLNRARMLKTNVTRTPRKNMKMLT
ncbi:hypothetical protein IGI04_035859 [Brassica rapa subsp. trilocularis]|uniref:Uncharacterized protein n=1 Tax=Brassica rapa subsp. trilocularis TaxID=1813537 RepID=A0ABQ7LFR5_BRACM|nr:hypothetical protein IGI04_035859 [Brassica rapa subsp. trilocularis]